MSIYTATRRHKSIGSKRFGSKTMTPAILSRLEAWPSSVLVADHMARKGGENFWQSLPWTMVASVSGMSTAPEPEEGLYGQEVNLAFCLSMAPTQTTANALRELIPGSQSASAWIVISIGHSSPSRAVCLFPLRALPSNVELTRPIQALSQ
jgi:hypothetical protein